MLSNNLSTNINATRKVNIDLNDKTLTGNVAFATAESGEIRLGAGQITGNLTVDTPNISFYNAATVNGTTTITDVADNTFTNNGILRGIVNLNDTNGARFVNHGTIALGLNINTSAEVKLDGTFTRVTLEGTGKVVLDGTIQTLNAEQDVVIEGGSVEVVKGHGAVAFVAEAPALKIKDLVTYNVPKDGVNYYGIQARVLLPESEVAKANDRDRVVVSLLVGERVVATSTSNYGPSVMFRNEYAGEKFYASTLFVPNGEYPSAAWTTTKWSNVVEADQPTGIKVELQREGRVIYSTTSSKGLNVEFVDGISTQPISWEQVLQHNSTQSAGN